MGFDLAEWTTPVPVLWAERGLLHGGGDVESKASSSPLLATYAWRRMPLALLTPADVPVFLPTSSRLQLQLCGVPLGQLDAFEAWLRRTKMFSPLPLVARHHPAAAWPAAAYSDGALPAQSQQPAAGSSAIPRTPCCPR